MIAVHNTGRWSEKYDACQECGNTDRRYMAKGLCTLCYSRQYKKTPTPIRPRPAQQPQEDYQKQARILTTANSALNAEVERLTSDNTSLRQLVEAAENQAIRLRNERDEMAKLVLNDHREWREVVKSIVKDRY